MLKKNVIRNACYRAIKNILYEGTTDVELFKRPFEINYLKKEEIQKELCNLISPAIQKVKFPELKVHKLGHVLVPKKIYQIIENVL